MAISFRGKKSIQQISIVEALWDVYSRMEDEMGIEKEMLVHQAMVAFAKTSGFSGEVSSTPDNAPGPAVEVRVTPSLATKRGADLPPPPPPPAPSRISVEHEDSRSKKLREELERQSKMERERKLREELDRIDKRPSPPPPPPPPADVPVQRASAAKAGLSLYLVTESGEMRKVDKERFLIGRDKKCDFSIDSSKVSREHAAIVKDRDGYYIEDLNSSNGTWFKQERITRHKIEDGNTYYVCNEKIKCVLR